MNENVWDRYGEAEGSDDTLIAELSQLPPLEYEKRRAEAAKSIGCRASILDRLVQDSRPKEANDDASGNAVLFPEVVPWGAPVDGGELLGDIAELIQRYVIVPRHADTALALWIIFTHVVEVADVAPILCLSSPEKRCGKTTVLTLVTRLACRPLPAANISAPALFRSVEKWAPTLLIDEADTFIRESPELNGIINSGHTRPTAFVIRTVGEDFEPRRFSTWGAKAIALIGKLPETLHDRSIVIELRRKLTGEAAEKLRHADRVGFDNLLRRIVRFSADNIDRIGTSRPHLPEALNDRAADNWEPLLAIADTAGGHWPERAREAALAISGASNDAPSVNQELLDDIREVFELKRCDRISTTDLIAALTEDDEKAWATYNRGKPITPKQIANRLREFKVTRSTFRIGNTTHKGYLRADMGDAFARYLPSPPAQSVTRSQPAPNKGFGPNSSVTRSDDVTDKKMPKPAQTLGCDRVTDRTPPDRTISDVERF